MSGKKINPYAKVLHDRRYRHKVIDNKKKKIKRYKLFELLERFR